jgi:aminoglycoside/choline kinase family phosphotransferase
LSPSEGIAPQRLQALAEWLRGACGIRSFNLSLAASDASVRRYLRVRHEGGSHIVMDAPPERERPHAFARMAQALGSLGLNVPQVLHADFAQGFLLLTDLGSRTYLDALDDSTVERLYGDALSALAVLQTCGSSQEPDWPPPYDEALLRHELELFREWLLQRHLGLHLDPAQHRVLDDAFAALIGSALEQPRVWVHRDYHSRNLMVAERNNPGILDFQDAVVGPVTYDLVSLLRDCYIAWPQERVRDWVQGYHELALQSGILHEDDEERFVRWFDWMGVQRHLKAAGIFCRLKLRDGKPGYMADVPRTLGYVVEVSRRYPELHALHALLLQTRVLTG